MKRRLLMLPAPAAAGAGTLGIVLAVAVFALSACGGAAAPAASSASASKPAASSAVSAGAKPAASTAASAGSKPAASAEVSASGKPAASAAAAPKPGAPTKLTAAYSTISAASAVPWISKGGGFFDKHGLNVDLQYLAPASLTAGILAGNVDVGWGSPGNVATADAQGADIVIVGTSYEGPIFAIVARSNVKDLKDLKGKKVTVTQHGSTSDLLLQEVIKQEGFAQGDVNVVYIPEATAQVAALASGAVDAAILTEPGTAQGIAQGGHVIYDPAQNKDQSSGSVSMSVVIVKRSWLASHRETLKQFLSANMDAVKLMKTNPAEAAKYTGPYLKIDDQKVLQSSVESFAKITNDDLSFSMASLKSILDTTAVSNPAVSKLKPEDIVDLSVLQDIKAGK